MRKLIPIIILLTTSLSVGQTDSLKVRKNSLDKFVDIDGVERGIFYHIGYNGSLSGREAQTLCWYVHKEVPNTHFIIEQLCWNKWINRGEVVSGKGIPGSGDYQGKISGKFLYKYKLPPHSGQNNWRVLLMNDSNVCLAISKVLLGIDSKGQTIAWTPKVDYTIKKKTKEICFSAETYYELYDPSGKLIDKGSTKTISYADLDKGTYTLNYDNFTETINLK